MKQGTPPPPTPPPTTMPTMKRSLSKSVEISLQSTATSRQRGQTKTKESLKAIEGVKISSARAKSVPPDLNNSRVRRNLVGNKHKSSSEDVLESRKGKEGEEVKVVGRFMNRQQGVEQFARPRRRTVDGRRNEDDPAEKNKELMRKVELSENLIKDLQSQVMCLKDELDKATSLNEKLESQNKKLTEDLAGAEAKIAAFTSCEQNKLNGEQQCSKFKDIQKLIANKLESSNFKREGIKEANAVKSPLPMPIPVYAKSSVIIMERKTPPGQSFPPPPPPPPPAIPPRPSARAAKNQKAPACVDLYHPLEKQEGKKESRESGNHHKAAAISAHSSIVGEIQNRSTHLLAIRADIETRGEFINGLIQKVLAAAYTDIKEVLKFVDWLDGELSSLADERAVLKHFNWPERKADALREAAVEYRDLKLLECEISSYKDDPDIPCGAALKKMVSLLDKSEHNIQRLIMLRSSVMHNYQYYKIPTAWMLDSGIMSKIKQASMNLVKMYMQRVKRELESVRFLDWESSQESLLLQGVNFVYRAYQFAGGLDSETLCAFEEMKQRVAGHLGGSQELFAGIASS